jgi:7-carboxy-7-deazaguanine synthase
VLKIKLEYVYKNINDIFFSIQGEGRYLGVPTLFFRFNKCNLDCKYCDTYFEESVFDTVEDLKECIDNFFKNYLIMHICFTGGEPMMFINDMRYIVDYIKNKIGVTNLTVKIETNGIIPLAKIIDDVRLIFTITPKLDYRMLYNKSTSSWKKEGIGELNFKFMIDSKYDIEHRLDNILRFINQHNHILGNNIYFSPVNENDIIDDVISTYKDLIKKLIIYRKHNIFKINIQGVTIQLNKLLEWK